MANNKIRIRLKSFDHKILDASAEKIISKMDFIETKIQILFFFSQRNICYSIKISLFPIIITYPLRYVAHTNWPAPPQPGPHQPYIRPPTPPPARSGPPPGREGESLAAARSIAFRPLC